ncbi:MAG: AsmA-like C-terminal region-containing protein [Desulfobacula sp.]|nr:AsmA-like C-terminal region-containing protein [Desulfobacula sp.]
MSFFLLAVLIIFSFSYVFHFAINTPYVKNQIVSVILERIGLQVNPTEISVNFFPKPEIILKNFVFAFDEKIILNIGQLKFDLDLKSLLKGRIILWQILIQNPTVNFPAKNSQQPIPHFEFKPVEFKNTVNKLFQFLPEDQETLEIKITNLVSPYFNRMDGSIVLIKAKKDLAIHAIVKKLDLHASDLSQISLNQSLNLDSIGLDQLELRASIQSDGEIRADVNGHGIMFKDKNKDLLLDTDRIHAVLNLSDTRYRLDIDPFKINYPEGVVEVHFFSDPPQKKSEIQFIGNNIHIGQAKKMSLAVFKNNGLVNHLFDILHDGVSPDINVSFKSDDPALIFQAVNLELKGRIENGLVKIPGTDLLVSNIHGSAGIQKGILDINATHATVGSSVLKQGQLTIHLLGFNHVPFNGEFSLDTDLSMVPKTLESLLPGTLLAEELAKTRNITGRSNVRLNLSIPNDTRELDVKIESDDFSVKGNYDRIPGPVSLEKINFQYNSDMVRLRHIQGAIADIIIKDLDAAIHFKENPNISIHSGSGRIPLDSTIRFLMANKKMEAFLSPLKKGTGKIDVNTLQLSGPLLMPREWVYDIAGTGSQLSLTTQSNQKEIEDLSCQYHFSSKGFSLESISARIENLSWLGAFVDKKYYESFRTPLIIRNGKLQTNEKKTWFNTDLSFPDGQNLQIEFDGNSLTSLILKNITLLDPGFSDAKINLSSDTNKTIFHFNGILNTQTIHKILLPGSDLEKKMTAFTEGETVLIHTDKDSIIHILTKKMNLTSFFSSQKPFSTKNNLLLDKTIKFKTENLTIKNWIIKDIDAEVSFQQDDAHILLNRAVLCDIETKGYINLKNDRVDAKIPFNADNKDNIQNLLTCLFNKTEFMDGRYSFKGEIISDAGKQNFLNTLNGSFLFQAEEGRVYKLTLLSRILSVLNVSSFFRGNIPDITQKGFAYKTISIEANIKDSNIHIKKAIIDGNDMTLIFIGWIDLIHDDMDLTCLVAPFKTIDLIIEKIPIVSTLLGGNLVSVPVKASGKVSDPSVVPLHPSAVGEGLINMMANILKTPVRLLDKLSDNEKDESVFKKK